VFLAISNHANFLGGGEHSFVDLLSHLFPSWKPVAVVPGRGDVATEIEAEQIALRVISLPSIRPWNIFPMIQSIRSYALLCKSVNSRLIYANGSRAAFYGGLAGRIVNVPVIWHCRMTGQDIYLDPILTRLSTFIIANSQATAMRFKKEFSRKVEVVHNGVDLQWLRDQTVEKPNFVHEDWEVILLVSRISRWKRHDLALAAFEYVASSNSNAHLVCVGAEDPLTPEWYQDLQRISHRSAFRDRVHWIGHVEDVRPWYRAAHILLMTSENEAFGRVLLEAMACGVPVVAMRSGGVPEIVRDGEDGLLVPTANAASIAKAAVEILVDNDLRGRLSKSAMNRAESFDITNYVRGVLRVFEETLQNWESPDN
jgi:glycosyltransferase involved in cell wall biosynthesis